MVLVRMAYQDRVGLDGRKVDVLAFLAERQAEVEQDGGPVCGQLDACAADLMAAPMDDDFHI